MLIDADDERLTAGFHDYEPAENIRWTSGYAELPIQLFARFDEGADVMIYLGGSTRYPDYGDKAHAGTSMSGLGVADNRNISSHLRAEAAFHIMPVRRRWSPMCGRGSSEV